MRPGAHSADSGSLTVAPRRDGVLLLLLTGLALLAVAWPALDGALLPGFPLDDGWIHAAYARNLAEHGEFALNPGTPSTGTTSLLWTALLGGLGFVGLSAPTGGLVAGALCLLLLVASFHDLLLLHGADRVPAAAAAAALPLSGITLWWALSGMETLLFLLLAVLALSAQARRRYTTSGVWLALLLLTRPEGVLLVPLIAAAAWRRERSLRPLLPLFLLAAAGVLVYLGWNLAVSGRLWTSTLEGRRWLALGGRDPEGIAGLPVAWASMLLRWARILVAGALREAGLGTWIAGILAVLSLAFSAMRSRRSAVPGSSPVASAWRSWRSAVPGSSPAPSRLRPLRGASARQAATSAVGLRQLLVMLFAWALLHTLAYAVMLPYPGHAGRYLAMLLLPLGCLPAMLHPRSVAFRKTRIVPLLLRHVLPGGLLLAGGVLLAVSAVTNWSAAWRASVDHINRVHRRAAEWVRTETPGDARIACYDVGAMAYFSGRTVVDLGGLSDPAAIPFMRGRIDEYILASGAEYVAMVAPHEGLHAPGFIPAALGYARSGLFRVHTVADFHIPVQDYRRHISLTGNAYPALLLQKILKSP